MNHTATRTECPTCRGTLEVFFEQLGVPVHCNVLARSASDALAAPRGDIRLGYCGGCGTIFNQSFDPGLLAYSADYENSLHFSPRFQGYAEELAARLIADYGLDGKSVLEIGCGKGDFLSLLAAGGRNRCTGFDSSYEGHQSGDLHIIRSFWDPEQARAAQADLVVCRHVLEHIGDPAAFVASVAPVLAPHGAVYFEVPDAMYTLRDLGVWDIIYEHCVYFTAPALARLFGDQDLSPHALYSSFGGQFLCLEARRGGSSELEPGVTLEEVASCVVRFGQEFSTIVEHWNTVLDDRLGRGQRIAVWGAGSKGVTFLNTVRRGAEVHAVVDINDRKWGRFVAGTGQPIIGPEQLVAGGVDAVIVMNPNYREEIGGQLRALGAEPEFL